MFSHETAKFGIRYKRGTHYFVALKQILEGCCEHMLNKNSLPYYTPVLDPNCVADGGMIQVCPELLYQDHAMTRIKQVEGTSDHLEKWITTTSITIRKE